MDLFKHLKKLEDRIESMFDPSSRNAGVSPAGASLVGETPPPIRLREPLELKKDVVARIEEEIRRIDGKPAFPFNRIDLQLWAPDERSRAILEAELLDGDRLQAEIFRVIERARVAPDRRLLLRAHFVDLDPSLELARSGFVVECSREQETERIPRAGVARAHLVVEQGEAEVAELPLAKARIHLGRLTEVFDQHGRVIRRNDLAFKDQEGVNASVSRVHAHITVDREAEEYRLFDDNSADGTVLFREGRRFDLPPGPRRGVTLKNGDEIYLGQARLRFVKH